MKKLAVLALLAATLSSPAWAVRSGDQGFGVMLGNPSGLSWKMWLGEEFAVDGAVGVNQGELDVHATLLLHIFQWGGNDPFLTDIRSRGDLPIYVGIGPRVLFEDEEEFGVRVPFGITYLPRSADFDFFAEFAPVIRFTPDQGFDGDFAIGARYYFRAIRPLNP